MGIVTSVKFRKLKKATGSQQQIRELVNTALKNKLSLEFQYHNEKGETVVRTVDPLYVDKHGNLRAWDELKSDYRSFKFDNIKSAKWSGTTFTTEDRNIPQIDENYCEVV